MHQAPSLAEAPPGSGSRPDEPRSSQYSMHGANTGIRSPSPGPVGDEDGGELGLDSTREPLSLRRTQSVSPPRRMDTYSSASAAGENMRQSRAPSAETTSNGYSLSGFSPTNHASSQGVFPVNGSDPSQNRRANRRRTGPLSADQRERAAIIRKMGACSDCRRRRVAVSMISSDGQQSLGGHGPMRFPFVDWKQMFCAASSPGGVDHVSSAECLAAVGFPAVTKPSPWDKLGSAHACGLCSDTRLASNDVVKSGCRQSGPWNPVATFFLANRACFPQAKPCRV